VRAKACASYRCTERIRLPRLGAVSPKVTGIPCPTIRFRSLNVMRRPLARRHASLAKTLWQWILLPLSLDLDKHRHRPDHGVSGHNPLCATTPYQSLRSILQTAQCIRPHPLLLFLGSHQRDASRTRIITRSIAPQEQLHQDGAPLPRP
jgi:hypothetical protein